ncbi:MAG: multiprotein bridging factor aMBF1 [Methanocellales archaeon]|nr:multiprotein bridging factor aMBF1 [Methanocellales archaeon]
MVDGNCEICGTEIKGKLHRIRIERSELSVCNDCARYGDVLKPKVEMKKARVKVPGRGNVYDVDEIVSNYSQVIRKARQLRNLTIEELAANIKERASLIKRIERGKIIPEESVRKKLERFLSIKLTEPIEKIELTHSTPKTLTLGDVAAIKRKR